MNTVENEQAALEFAKRVENMVKKEKAGAVRREMLTNIISPISAILAPWTGRSGEALVGFAGLTQGTSYIQSVKGWKDNPDYQQIWNKLFTIFGREADRDMPEIEREVKTAEVLSSGIRNLSNDAVRFIQSRTAFQSGLWSIGLSLSLMAIPPLLGLGAAVAGGTALASLGITAGITATASAATLLATAPLAKARRKTLQEEQDALVKSTQKVNRAQYAALANPALKSNTQSGDLLFKKLDQKTQEQLGIVQRILGKVQKNISRSFISTALINAGVLVGCWATGMPISAMATIWMGTNVINNSILKMQDAHFRMKSASDTMYAQYNNIRHNKVYDLEYGSARIPDHADTICLKNICYAHRYNGSESDRVGLRSDIPAIQSDNTIFFGPGINIIGGASGAGKSTFYKLLRHADDLTYGSISYGVGQGQKFKGIKLTETPKDAVNRHIAFCFQDIENDGQTGLDILHAGNPYMKEEHLVAAAENLELGLYKETPDKGREPKLFREMSGGEKKRILFLQAYLSPKRILVFDEPTSGVDPTLSRKMLDMLNDDYIEIDGKKQKRTILYTTHNPDDLKHLNITQVVDFAPTQNPDRIKDFVAKHGVDRLPTDIQVYPFTTESEKSAYLDLVKSRDRDSSDHSGSVKHDIQKFISLSISNLLQRRQEAEKDLNQKAHTDSSSFLKWGVHKSAFDGR